MKNTALTLLLITTLSNLCAQQGNPFSTLNYCSHSKMHPSLLSGQPAYSQSPLLNHYDVIFYFLDLAVTPMNVSVSGSVRIDARSMVDHLDVFVLELLDELTIDSIIFNDLNASFIHNNNEVHVTVPVFIGFNDTFSATVYYHGIPPSGGFFSGISSSYSTEWSQHVTWTLSEPFNARQWWPTKQVLEDKADSSWFFLTTDTSYLSGSQGILTNIVDLQNGTHRLEWKSQYPIDYYLISFSVSDYQVYNIFAHPQSLTNDSILIQNYIYDSPGCLGHYKNGLNNTVSFLELFSDLYSLYPFYKEKYGHCIADLGGGMEHQTMSTMGSFGFGIVAHELGHMWWGDHVTCATWSDIWINEGFATYSDYLAHEFVAGGEWPQIWLRQVHQKVLVEPGGSVYIPPDEIDPDDPLTVNRIFNNRLSYLKGASIIHMLRWELQNDGLFWELLQSFQQAYADSVATGTDFLNHLNAFTGEDFTYFFNQWYFGEGYPIFDIDWQQNDGLLQVHSLQTPSSEVTGFFRMLLPFQLLFEDGADSTVLFEQTSHENDFLVPNLPVVRQIVLDPLNWVLDSVRSIHYHTIHEDGPYAFSLHPNPVHGSVFICIANPSIQNKSVRIFNDSGQLLISTPLHYSTTIIDMHTYSSGILLVELNLDNHIFCKKLIKF